MWVWVKKLCFINIFTRTFRTDDKICVWEFFLFISVTICTHYWCADGGDRGSGRMPSTLVRCYRVSQRLSSGLSIVRRLPLFRELVKHYFNDVGVRYDLFSKKFIIQRALRASARQMHDLIIVGLALINDT